MVIKPIKRKISKFENQYANLSNFADSMICHEYIFYPTVEHYFQAMKTLDPEERQKRFAGCRVCVRHLFR